MSRPAFWVPGYASTIVEMDSFAAMTRRVIESEGFARYLPTACFPERRVLRVLEGAPETSNLEAIVLEWAQSWLEGDEEMLVAFRLDDAHFKVVRRAAGLAEERVYGVDDEAVLPARH